MCLALIVLFVMTTLLSVVFLGSVMIHGIFAIPAISFTWPAAGHLIAWAVHLTFWFAVAPFCWIVTYQRLKESEI